MRVDRRVVLVVGARVDGVVVLWSCMLAMLTLRTTIRLLGRLSGAGVFEKTCCPGSSKGAGV
jgi:hypothetical protein